jgi:hypothetical protein
MAFASLRLHTVQVVVSTDAKTAADAMRLAHDGAVEGGFLSPKPSGMRFSPTFLNPGTEFVVAYADEQPIASLVLTEDGPFGLPSDRSFVEEIDQFRRDGDSLFEAGAWVVTNEWRRHTLALIGLIFGAAMRLNIATSPARRMIAVIEPRRADLFGAIFGYELATEPRPYLLLPGTLMVTRRASEWTDHFLEPGAPAARRIVADRLFDAEPDWLRLSRPGHHWTETILPELLHESGIHERVSAQLRLLSGVGLPDRMVPAEI